MNNLFASYIFIESNQDAAGLEVILSEADVSMSNLEKSGTLMSVVATLNENVQMLNEGMAEVWNKIKEIFKKFLESVKAFFSRIWTKIYMSIAKQEDFVKKNMSKIMQGANYADKDGEEDKIDFIENIEKNITDWEKNLTKILNAGTISSYHIDSKSYKTDKSIYDLLEVLSGNEGFTAIHCTDPTILIHKVFLDKLDITSNYGYGTINIPLFNKKKIINGNSIGVLESDIKNAIIVGIKNDHSDDIPVEPSSVTAIVIPKIMFESKTVMASIKDGKDKINEEIEAILSGTKEVNISKVINSATGWFSRSSKNTRDTIQKELLKDEKTLMTTLSRIKNPNPSDGSMLRLSYMIINFKFFTNSKYILLLNKCTNHMWSIIKKAMGNFAYVNKQRNLGK